MPFSLVGLPCYAHPPTPAALERSKRISMLRVFRSLMLAIAAVTLSTGPANAQECDRSANLAAIVNATSRDISKPGSQTRVWRCLKATADRPDVLTAARRSDRAFFWFRYSKMAIVLEENAVAPEKSALIKAAVSGFNRYFGEYKELTNAERQNVCDAGAGADAAQIELQAIAVRYKDHRIDTLLMSATFDYSCKPTGPELGVVNLSVKK